MRLLTLALHGVIVTAIAATSLKSQTVATVDSGMTRTQVVAALGTPLSTHSYGDFTYLFYRNGCERKCGMNDIVVFDSGAVVDAIFRSPGRKYSGTSSSPHMLAEPAAKHATAPLRIGAAAAKKPMPPARPAASPTKVPVKVAEELPAKTAAKVPPKPPAKLPAKQAAKEPLTSSPQASLH